MDKHVVQPIYLSQASHIPYITWLEELQSTETTERASKTIQLVSLDPLCEATHRHCDTVGNVPSVCLE